MARVTITESYLTDIADAIRSKKGVTTTYSPSEMADTILTIGGGGITPTGTIDITSNNTYNVTNYASAYVHVPTGSTINNQDKEVTPTKSTQYITADSGSDYTGLGTVTINPIPNQYIVPTGTKDITANGTGIDVAAYASVDVAVPGGGGSPTLQTKTKSYTPSETAQSEDVTADNGYDGLEKVSVSVGAISSSYVGSGITRCDSTNLSESGGTVTASAGYYAETASKSVTAMTLPTTTSSSATSGYTSKASIDASTSAKYINIPTGYNSAGAYYKINALSTMTLPTSAAASATSGYTSKATISRSTSDQYINIPTGYNSAGAYYKVSAVANGSVTAPSTISGTSATVSNSSTTITLTKTVSVTPSVTTAGYISSGTAGNASVSLSATDSNFDAANIKNGVTLFGKTGTYTGSGGSSDFKSGTLTVSSNINTSTSTKITDTTEIGFTPRVFVFARSDRSATSNHVNAATFTQLGTSSYYIRTRTRYSSNALSTSGDTNNWTTQTSGYLYFNSNTVYFRSSSSNILASGTWNWYAIK